jgi:hypothetical protein
VNGVSGALRRLLGASPAAGRLLELLGHRDAGRVVGIIHELASECRHVRDAVPRVPLDGGPAVEYTALQEACDAFAKAHGIDGPSFGALGHIGRPVVIDDDEQIVSGRYGFSSARSIETFEELLRYVSAACHGWVRVLSCAEAPVAALQAIERARVDSREVEEWTRVAGVLERAAAAVRHVLSQTDDFDQQRQALASRAAREADTSVAALLSAVARVPSRRAWLFKSPDSRLVYVQPRGAWRLRLGFGDGRAWEIELGADYWSTTGLDVDPPAFASVRIDDARNLLVWSNGHTDSGERLHLAIAEGRLAARAIDPLPVHAIVPGRSIGPIALGMTREQVEASGPGPDTTTGPDGSMRFSMGGAWNDPHQGITVWFDGSGRCCRLGAVFSYDLSPPVFTLLGRIVNGMTTGDAFDLIRAAAPDARWTYGGPEAASLGLSVSTWEASDDQIMSAWVEPPRATT